MSAGRLPFADEIDAFVRHKRAMGFKYVREEGTLRRFSQFCDQRGFDGPDLGREVVDAWCERWPHEPERGGSGHAARVSVIRQFGTWMSEVLGREVHLPVNVANNLSRHSAYVARVLTRDEVSRLLAAADRICPHRRSTMHAVMPTLLRLLYSSGTRITETLELRMRDVDLEGGVLRMEHAKGGKVRLVPLSASMAEALRAYCAVMHPEPEPDDHLFCNAQGGRIKNQTVYRRFRELLADAGIPHGGRGAGPRVHDLRHTMACHALMAASEAGEDLRALLPVLSQYLGHRSVRETERYLRMTAEVYPDVEALVERACGHVVPEVGADG